MRKILYRQAICSDWRQEINSFFSNDKVVVWWGRKTCCAARTARRPSRQLKPCPVRSRKFPGAVERLARVLLSFCVLASSPKIEPLGIRVSGPLRAEERVVTP